MENKIALGLLKDRLDQLTNMSWEERQESLALGTHIACRSYLNIYHTLLILILLKSPYQSILPFNSSVFNISGFLAGNVFDWGAKEVALLMEAGQLDFR